MESKATNFQSFFTDRFEQKITSAITLANNQLLSPYQKLLLLLITLIKTKALAMLTWKRLKKKKNKEEQNWV